MCSVIYGSIHYTDVTWSGDMSRALFLLQVKKRQNNIHFNVIKSDDDTLLVRKGYKLYNILRSDVTIGLL